MHVGPRGSKIYFFFFAFSLQKKSLNKFNLQVQNILQFSSHDFTRRPVVFFIVIFGEKETVINIFVANPEELLLLVPHN